MNEYDAKNEQQREFMKTYASAAIVIPQEEWRQTQNTEPKWKREKKRRHSN